MSIVTGLLNQKVTTIYSVARDGYGRITKTELYSDIPCRWQETFNQVLDKVGNEVMARVQVWLPDMYNGEVLDIDNDYVFTYNGRDYTVITCEYHPNLLGDLEFIKAYLR